VHSHTGGWGSAVDVLRGRLGSSHHVWGAAHVHKEGIGATRQPAEHQHPCALLWVAQEATVVPVLMQGMQALCKERPDNPIEFLAYYLLSHNEQEKKKAEAGAAAPPAAAAAVSGGEAAPGSA
jgi:hypothetical protein